MTPEPPTTTDTHPDHHHKVPGSKKELKEKALASGSLPAHKAAHQMPVSRTSNAGGRNILRRHGGGGAARKEAVNKHHATDDGTLDDAEAALDARDPNYDSPNDPAVVSNFE